MVGDVPMRLIVGCQILELLGFSTELLLVMAVLVVSDENFLGNCALAVAIRHASVLVRPMTSGDCHCVYDPNCSTSSFRAVMHER